MKRSTVLCSLLLALFLTSSSPVTAASKDADAWKASFTPTKLDWLALRLEVQYGGVPSDLHAISFSAGEDGVLTIQVWGPRKTTQHRFDEMNASILRNVQLIANDLHLAPPTVQITMERDAAPGTSVNTRWIVECRLPSWETAGSYPDIRRDCHATTF